MNPSKFPDWHGRTCVIMASGPSLTQNQVNQIFHNVAIIAVNSTWKMCPGADVVYAGDHLWWKKSISDLREAAYVKQKNLWTCDSSAAERWGLNWVKGVHRPGLSKEKYIHTNGNSGFQAINLAYMFGCRRILLLGFDMKLGPNGEKHHHADHPSPLMQAQTFGDWIHKSEFLARDLKDAGCEVINCSGDTALTCWPRSTIEKELT